MSEDVSEVLRLAAKNMAPEALRDAVRDCLAWSTGGQAPVEGRLASLAAEAERAGETMGPTYRLSLAAAAVQREALGRFARLAPIFPTGSLARVYEASGHPIEQLVGVEAQVTYRDATKCAQAFNASGELIGELRDVHVDWIHTGGIRLIGVEAMGEGAQLRRQAWHYIPPGL